MKTKITLRAGLVALWLICAIACRTNDSGQPLTLTSPVESEEAALFSSEDTLEKNGDVENAVVWVCNSSGAKKYHFSRDCGGLKKCKHEIKACNVKEAEAIGLTQCSFKKCK